MLRGSTKVTDLEIFHGWARVWSDVYPHVAQSDLDEQFKIDRALLFRKLITSLPRLNYLKFDFDKTMEFYELPSDITEFDSFPDVANLALNMWPFDKLGPKSLQTQFRPTVLQKLRIFNAFDIDDLFEILVRSGIQLKHLLVMFAKRDEPPQHPTVSTWPEFTTFLLQQTYIEELLLAKCEMRTVPIITCALQNGASLKTLSLHMYERCTGPRVEYYEDFRPSLEHQPLEQIQISCDVLEKLRIDMPLEELVAVSPAPFQRPQLKTHALHPLSPPQTTFESSTHQ